MKNACCDTKSKNRKPLTFCRKARLRQKYAEHQIQWSLSIKGTPKKEHLSIEDTVCCPNHIELCTNLPLNVRDTSLYRTASWVSMVSSIERFHCIQDSQLGLNGVLYREVPLYIKVNSLEPLTALNTRQPVAQV